MKGASVPFTLVHSRRKDQSCLKLDESVTHVHIAGYPYKWLLEAIVRCAPNVRTIRIVPAYKDKLTTTHLNFFRENKILMVIGCRHAAHGWKGKRIHRSSRFKERRRFLLDLRGEQKERFEALLRLGFREAIIAARYYCLRGEEAITLFEIARLFDFQNVANDSYISKLIIAVLHYLDPSFYATGEAEQTAKVIATRVKRLRDAQENTRKLQCLAEREAIITARYIAEARQLGFGYPTRIPIKKAPTYCALLRKVVDGELLVLRQKSPKRYEAIVLRFGIDNPKQPVYRSYTQVAKIMGGTRQNIGLLVPSGLRLLGITNQ